MNYDSREMNETPAIFNQFMGERETRFMLLLGRFSCEIPQSVVSDREYLASMIVSDDVRWQMAF